MSECSGNSDLDFRSDDDMSDVVRPGLDLPLSTDGPAAILINDVAISGCQNSGGSGGKPSKDELTYKIKKSNQDDILKRLSGTNENLPPITLSPCGNIQISSMNININGTFNMVSFNNCPLSTTTRCSNVNIPANVDPNVEKTIIKVPKGMINQRVAMNVASMIAPNWKKLGHLLAFTPTELDVLQYDNNCYGVEEICYQLLMDWMEKMSAKATYLALGNALKSLKRKDVIVKFPEFAKDP